MSKCPEIWFCQRREFLVVKILLVDDHELVRTGIKRILEDVEGLQVAGEADSGEAAVDWIKKNSADVVLMDMVMPGMNGLEATAKMLRIRPDAKVIVLSMQTEDPFPTKVMQAGGFGYLSKSASPDEMIAAIRTVSKGRKYLSAEIAQQLALSAMQPHESENPFKQLSERELQVTLLITQGTKVADIAQKLCLTPKTVNSYRYRIFEKLGIEGDVELTRLAIRYDLIKN